MKGRGNIHENGSNGNLEMLWMGGAIGTQEESGAAAGGSSQHSLSMLLSLQDR